MRLGRGTGEHHNTGLLHSRGTIRGSRGQRSTTDDGVHYCEHTHSLVYHDGRERGIERDATCHQLRGNEVGTRVFTPNHGTGLVMRVWCLKFDAGTNKQSSTV